ncbi:RDD family protein [soil metagenome]
MSNSTDFLREEYTIDTPENVTFGYEIAGIGSRFIGALVDTFILVIALIVLNILLGLLLAWSEGPKQLFNTNFEDEISWLGGLLLALYTLLNFALIWGYFIVFELVWNGQTPGKRLAKTRVVRMDGNPAGFIEIAVRNLVRIVDFLPGAYAIGLITMFFNHRARRLGDFAAGTLVVKERAEIGLTSLGATIRANKAPVDSAAQPEVDVLAQRFPTLRRLSANDMDLVQDALNRHAAGKVDAAVLQRLAAAIAAKLEVALPGQGEQMARDFLQEVTAAYHRAG